MASAWIVELDVGHLGPWNLVLGVHQRGGAADQSEGEGRVAVPCGPSAFQERDEMLEKQSSLRNDIKAVVLARQRLCV